MNLTNSSKISEVKSLAREGLYDEAAELGDRIAIEKIESQHDLFVLADIYVRANRPEDAKRIYRNLYERNKTHRIMVGLIDLCLKTRDPQTAEQYLREFRKMEPDSPDRLILRYRVDCQLGKSNEYLLKSLTKLRDEDYTDIWALELAKVYYKNGDYALCAKECKNICIWFDGSDVARKARVLWQSCKEKGVRLDGESYTPEYLSKKNETAEEAAFSETAEAAQRVAETEAPIDETAVSADVSTAAPRARLEESVLGAGAGADEGVPLEDPGLFSHIGEIVSDVMKADELEAVINRYQGGEQNGEAFSEEAAEENALNEGITLELDAEEIDEAVRKAEQRTENASGETPFGEQPYGGSEAGENASDETPFGEQPYDRSEDGENASGETPFGEQPYGGSEAGENASGETQHDGLGDRLNAAAASETEATVSSEEHAEELRMARDMAAASSQNIGISGDFDAAWGMATAGTLVTSLTEGGAEAPSPAYVAAVKAAESGDGAEEENTASGSAREEAETASGSAEEKEEKTAFHETAEEGHPENAGAVSGEAEVSESISDAAASEDFPEELPEIDLGEIAEFAEAERRSAAALQERFGLPGEEARKLEKVLTDDDDEDEYVITGYFNGREEQAGAENANEAEETADDENAFTEAGAEEPAAAFTEADAEETEAEFTESGTEEPAVEASARTYGAEAGDVPADAVLSEEEISEKMIEESLAAEIGKLFDEEIGRDENAAAWEEPGRTGETVGNDTEEPGGTEETAGDDTKESVGAEETVGNDTEEPGGTEETAGEAAGDTAAASSPELDPVTGYPKEWNIIYDDDDDDDELLQEAAGEGASSEEKPENEAEETEARSESSENETGSPSEYTEEELRSAARLFGMGNLAKDVTAEDLAGYFANAGTKDTAFTAAAEADDGSSSEITEALTEPFSEAAETATEPSCETAETVTEPFCEAAETVVEPSSEAAETVTELSCEAAEASLTKETETPAATDHSFREIAFSTEEPEIMPEYEVVEPRQLSLFEDMTLTLEGSEEENASLAEEVTRISDELPKEESFDGVPVDFETTKDLGNLNREVGRKLGSSFIDDEPEEAPELDEKSLAELVPETAADSGLREFSAAEPAPSVKAQNVTEIEEKPENGNAASIGEITAFTTAAALAGAGAIGYGGSEAAGISGAFAESAAEAAGSGKMYGSGCTAAACGTAAGGMEAAAREADDVTDTVTKEADTVLNSAATAFEETAATEPVGEPGASAEPTPAAEESATEPAAENSAGESAESAEPDNVTEEPTAENSACESAEPAEPDNVTEEPAAEAPVIPERKKTVDELVREKLGILEEEAEREKEEELAKLTDEERAERAALEAMFREDDEAMERALYSLLGEEGK